MYGSGNAGSSVTTDILYDSNIIATDTKTLQRGNTTANAFTKEDYGHVYIPSGETFLVRITGSNEAFPCYQASDSFSGSLFSYTTKNPILCSPAPLISL